MFIYLFRNPLIKLSVVSSLKKEKKKESWVLWMMFASFKDWIWGFKNEDLKYLNVQGPLELTDCYY